MTAHPLTDCKYPFGFPYKSGKKIKTIKDINGHNKKI